MAKANVDVYKDWLQIEATNRPLTYYQLLKLTDFEDDSIKIRKQYRAINTHVRKYASGDFLDESQALLNEIAKAMLCLTDAVRKADYDMSLGRKTESTRKRATIGQILVASKILSLEQLKECQKYADAIGLDLHQAVLQKKFAQPERVMLAYAEAVGLPFISLEDVGVLGDIASQINPNTARSHSFVPVMIDQGQLILASPSPVDLDVESELRMIFDMPVRCAICIPSEINAAVAKYYPRDAVQMIVKKGMATPVSALSANRAKSGSPDSNAPERVRQERQPLNDEGKKVRFQSTIVAFNFGFLVPFLTLTQALGFSIGLIPIAAGVFCGAIAAAGTWAFYSQ